MQCPILKIPKAKRARDIGQPMAGGYKLLSIVYTVSSCNTVIFVYLNKPRLRKGSEGCSVKRGAPVKRAALAGPGVALGVNE
jgi:hypothetical protein